MIRAVILDLWGTLANRLNDRKASYPRGILRYLGNDRNMRRSVHDFFFLSDFATVEQAVAALGSKANQDDAQLLNELAAFISGSINRTFIYADAIPALQQLKPKYRLGLLSNTDSLSVRKLPPEMLAFFDAVHFSFATKRLKPSPQAFLAIAQELGVRPEEAVMVGDSLTSDVEGACGAGMAAVHLLRPDATHRETGASAAAGVTSLSQLQQALHSLERKALKQPAKST
jgi:HAD superfamily hydrolase (TIGR01549 family)